MRRSRAVLPDLSPSCTIPPDARTVNKYVMFLHPGEYCKMQGAGRKKEQIEITVYNPDGTIIRPISYR
jgi:hypothetical protein